MGVVSSPGSGKRMLDEIAPLLAAEGIDLDDLGDTDLDEVNAALARATERHTSYCSRRSRSESGTEVRMSAVDEMLKV